MGAASGYTAMGIEYSSAEHTPLRCSCVHDQEGNVVTKSYQLSSDSGSPGFNT